MLNLEWKNKTRQQKEEYLLQMEERLNKENQTGWSFQGLEEFDYGMETGVFLSNDKSRFIYIPADITKSGFHKELSIPIFMLVLLKSEYTIAYNDDVDILEILEGQMSPWRTIQVPEMLVEQVERIIKINEDTKEGSASVNNQKIKKALYNEDIVVFEKEYIPKDMVRSVELSGYSIMTENEWEYLQSCGYQALFPKKLMDIICDKVNFSLEKEWLSTDRITYQIKWNNFNYKLAHELESEIIELHVLLRVLEQKNNEFGIHIGFNPWISELVDSPCIIKGSDGGGGDHGGYWILALLPLSPYYRDLESSFEEMIQTEQAVLRRIVRIK